MYIPDRDRMFADIVLARRLPRQFSTLTYLIPVELKNLITIGQLVTVPFGKSLQYGVVIKTTATAPSLPPQQVLKKIKSIINPAPALTAPQLFFLQEISLLYQTSLGWLIKNTLFPLQKSKVAAFTTASNTYPFPTSSKNSAKINFFHHQSTNELDAFLQAELIKNSGQQLILVPEIDQLNAVKKSIPADLKTTAVLFDSSTKPKELFSIWLRLWRGEPLLVIGTRSALFLPWSVLTHIFVLDEANPNYKSFDAAPRIETRDAARMLAWQHKAHLTLCGSVPSLETYYFSKQGLYEHNLAEPLFEKATKTNHPIEIINLNDEQYRGNRSPLSEQATEALGEIKENEMAICIVNRRGSASYITCQDCRFIWRCRECDRPLISHEAARVLECRFCKTKQPLPSTCPNCRGALIKFSGTGTEKVERLLKPLASSQKATLIRLDADTKNKLPPTTAPLWLVTTTLTASGIPWAKVRLVVFVDPDSLLFIPEFKITERLWYYLQTARYLIPPTARCLLQTRHPDQAIFTQLAAPSVWYSEELKQRRRFKYPPYWFLLKLSFEHADRAAATREADRLFKQLNALTELKEDAIVMPPTPCYPERSKKGFGYIILIKLKLATYKQTAKKCLAFVPAEWKTDLNPLDLLSP